MEKNVETEKSAETFPLFKAWMLMSVCGLPLGVLGCGIIQLEKQCGLVSGIVEVVLTTVLTIMLIPLGILGCVVLVLVWLIGPSQSSCGPTPTVIIGGRIKVD